MQAFFACFFIIGIGSAVYFLQVEVHLVYCVVVFQKRWIFFFQLQYNLLCAVQMQTGVAACILQTVDVRVHQRTVGIKIKTFVFWVVAQWVEFASKGFVLAHRATLWTQVCALLFYAYAAQALLLHSGQGDFKRWVPFLDVAASLALGTVVKQHAWAPVKQGLGAACCSIKLLCWTSSSAMV